MTNEVSQSIYNCETVCLQSGCMSECDEEGVQLCEKCPLNQKLPVAKILLTGIDDGVIVAGV